MNVIARYYVDGILFGDITTSCHLHDASTDSCKCDGVFFHMDESKFIRGIAHHHHSTTRRLTALFPYHHCDIVRTGNLDLFLPPEPHERPDHAASKK